MRSRGCGPWGAWRGTEAPPDLRERTLPPGGERLPRGLHARGAFVSRPRAAPGRLGTLAGDVGGPRFFRGVSLQLCVHRAPCCARVCDGEGPEMCRAYPLKCQALPGGDTWRPEEETGASQTESALGQSPGVNPTSPPPAPRPGPRKLLEHKKQELSGEMSGRRLSLSEALPHSLSLHLPITR